MARARRSAVSPKTPAGRISRLTRIWYLATVDGDVLKVIASKDSRRDWPHLDTIWLSTFLVARPFARDLVVIWRAHHAPLPAR